MAVTKAMRECEAAGVGSPQWISPLVLEAGNTAGFNGTAAAAGHTPDLPQQPILLLWTEHYHSLGWGGAQWAASLPSTLTCHSPSQGCYCPSSAFSSAPNAGSLRQAGWLSPNTEE